MDDLMPTRMKMKDYNEIFTDFYKFKNAIFVHPWLSLHLFIIGFPVFTPLISPSSMYFLVVVVISLNPLKWYMTLEVDGLFGGRGFFEAVKPDVLCKFCVHT